MSNVRPARPPRALRRRPSAALESRSPRSHRVVAAAVIGLVLLAAAAVPALGRDAGGRLFDASVTPRAAGAGTPVTFAVSYRGDHQVLPAWVSVRVGGTAHSMTMISSSGDSSRYRTAATLTDGTWPVRFEAATLLGGVVTLDAGEVTIGSGSPGPAGTPTPRPSADGTPRPTPKPTPDAGGDPAPSPSAGQPTSAPKPTPKPTGEAAPNPTPTAADEPAPSGRSSPAPAPISSSGGGSASNGASGSEPTSPLRPPIPPDAAPGSGSSVSGVIEPLPSASLDPTTAGLLDDASSGNGGGDGTATNATRSSGSPAFAFASAWLPPILGGPDLTAAERVLATTVTTATGVTLAMAFAFFGKRRRDSEPTAPDEVLEAAAQRGTEPAAASLAPEPVATGELALPRWRRPSLLEARKADPARTPISHARMTFAPDTPPAAVGLERRRIRYRVVRLLDAPDELLASEVGLLDEGDEVQLVERNGSFWRVTCPDGRTGWVHRMVLGDIVAGGDERAPEVDASLLSALLDARREAS